jgi:hypothetical protein
MWGLKWGQMVWGHLVSTPAMPGLFTLLLGVLLGLYGRRALALGGRHRRSGIVALGLLVLLASRVAYATVPFTFTNGTVADANQVNQNFAAHDTSINTLTSKVNAGAVDIDESLFRARSGSAQVNFGFGNGGAAIVSGTDFELVAPVPIPDGAHLTSVTILVNDLDATNNIRACIQGIELTGGYGNFGCVTTSGAAGIQTVTFTPTATPQGNGLFLQLVLTSIDGSGNFVAWSGAVLFAGGARFNYSF